MATVSAVAGGITVSVAVFVSPAYVAETLTVVETLTGVVVTVKLALVAPAATVTLGGTLATYSNLDRGSAGAYVQRGAFSLSAYAGQTIRVQFRATGNGSLTTSFLVDDVSVR